MIIRLYCLSRKCITKSIVFTINNNEQLCISIIVIDNNLYDKKERKRTFSSLNILKNVTNK